MLNDAKNYKSDDKQDWKEIEKKSQKTLAVMNLFH